MPGMPTTMTSRRMMNGTTESATASPLLAKYLNVWLASQNLTDVSVKVSGNSVIVSHLPEECTQNFPLPVPGSGYASNSQNVRIVMLAVDLISPNSTPTTLQRENEPFRFLSLVTPIRHLVDTNLVEYLLNGSSGYFTPFKSVPIQGSPDFSNLPTIVDTFSKFSPNLMTPTYGFQKKFTFAIVYTTSNTGVNVTNK
jgi:hypothetical protein